MVCVKTALPLFHVSATLDTLAPSVISKFRSATATHVRTEAAALIWSMPTSVTAHLEPQVGMCERWICILLYKLLYCNFYTSSMSLYWWATLYIVPFTISREHLS